MFYTIQMRDRSGILHYRSSDMAGWTVKQDRAITFGSESAARSSAAVYSKTEPNDVSVVAHDGAWIVSAPRSTVAIFNNGKLTANG